MKRHFFKSITTALLMAGTVAGCQTVLAEDLIHKAYEMPVFIDDKTPQGPGTHLNGPGDSYSYTFILDDKYTKSDKYRIKRAIFGVHVIDGDYDAQKGDQKPEWGSITMDGETREWMVPAHLKAEYRLDQTPVNSNFYEIESDAEHQDAPPYIYSVADLLNDNMLKIKVTNLRSDGTVDSDAPFGDFNVLRIGLHVWWEEIK